MPDSGTTALRPVLVLALDGATFDVIRPLAAAGRLPNLARWMDGGRHAPLASTTPPVTFPAWSSFMTGREPRDHGIFDFTQKLPGQYRLRFVNADDRAGASLFRRVSDAGAEALVLGLPATYPPEDLRGLLVCGFDAPVSAGTDARSASDPELYRAIANEAGPWMRPELDEGARADDFHERAVETLLRRIDRKRDFALAALRRLERPAFTMVVFSESDTAGHHYWRDHDPGSPRHDPSASAVRRGALAAVYERLDAACGVLREAAGPEALCVVLSDHGMGSASDKVVHLNRFLEQRGWLARRGGAGRQLARGAAALRDRALAWLPPRVAQGVFRRARGAAAALESQARFGGFDWSRTRAFSEEANTNPGIWVNLAGREPAGCVPPADYEATRDALLAELAAWRLPSGKPVVERAFRREEVHPGKFCERVPDVVFELALDDGHGLSLVRTPWDAPAASRSGEPGPEAIRVLASREFGGGRGRGMNGTHRADGIWIAAGPGADAAPPGRLAEVAPWLARAMGLAWIDHEGASVQAAPPAARPYDDDEEAMVAERLRALGYLE